MAIAPELAFEYGTPEGLDPIKFGVELDIIFAPEDIHELMGSELGQGIMLGVYLRQQLHEAIEREEADDEQADF